MLSSQHRLRKAKDFQRVRNLGQRVFNKYFVISWVKNDLGTARVGFIASKKVGKAVQRNRAIRLLRESIRLNLDRIKPGFDIVLIARVGIDRQKRPEIERELLAVLKRIALLGSNNPNYK